MKRRQESTVMGIELVDLLPGQVWTAFPDGRGDFFNQRWRDYTGLSMEQASGQGWRATVYPDDLPVLLAAWQSCIDAGKPGEVEARVRRHDGVYRWFLFRCSPLTDASGKVYKWCGINTDIEDRKRAEAAVRAHEQRFRLIVDGLPTGVVLMSPEGIPLHANQWALEYTKVPLEEQKNWMNNDMVHPEDRLASIATFQKAVASGQPYDAETRYRRADGVYRWFHVNGFPLRDDGRIVLWYFLFTDIEERKRAQLLLAGEKRLLEMVALGLPLRTVLDAVCALLQEIDDGCHGGILLIDPVSKTFQIGGACSGTSGYLDALQGHSIAGEHGPCAMAALSKAQIIVEDVASDPRWSQRWRELTLAHGVRACWSTPILSRAGEILGSFASCRTEPGAPTPGELASIEQLTHIAGIAIERAQNEVAVRRSEEGYRALVETTLECATLIAHDGTLLRINAIGAGAIGAPSADALIGKSYYDFIAPEHRQRYMEFQRGMGEGQRGVLEVDMITLRGERRHIETRATKVEHMDGTMALLGMTRDITERKQAEEDLRRREALMAKAQRISSTGSFCWNVDSGEITWSDELYRIFEVDPGTRITLELIAEHHHPGDLNLVGDMVDRAQAGLDFEYEHRILMPNGSTKYLHTQAHATRDQQGRLEYIGAAQDVTRKRQSEEALGSLRAELAHLGRVNSLGALTASIAHEINQPLAGIITNASTGLRMLAADPPNIEGASETVRRTLRDGRRASDVVTRLRALYSKKVVMSDVVDLNEAANEVVDLLRSEMRRHRIVLQLESAKDLPPVTGDRVQLQQVILNLLLNAIEAMHGVDGRPRSLLVRTQREAGDQVHLVVCDAGSGIDPQHAGHLFDAFYSTKREGMGIGLSVSRSIIEGHGGRMWATSNEGPGATFSFSIPCQSSSATPADTAGTPPLFAASHIGGT